MGTEEGQRRCALDVRTCMGAVVCVRAFECVSLSNKEEEGDSCASYIQNMFSTCVVLSINT